MLQSFNYFCDPPLDPLQKLHVSPSLRSPELDTALHAEERGTITSRTLFPPWLFLMQSSPQPRTGTPDRDREPGQSRRSWELLRAQRSRAAAIQCPGGPLLVLFKTIGRELIKRADLKMSNFNTLLCYWIKLKGRHHHVI